MEKKTEWRCPYCDALNDWEDDVCQICGDGKRDGTVETVREKTVKETYGSEPRSIQNLETVKERKAVEEQKPIEEQKPVEKTVPIKETEYTTPKSSDTMPTAETKAEPAKKAVVFPTQCILSVICLAFMFYIYKIDMVQSDETSITVWFGTMAVICVANLGTIWLKWKIFYITKFITDGMGIVVTFIWFISLSPYLLEKIRDIGDSAIVLLVVVCWGIAALNLWLTSDARRKK